MLELKKISAAQAHEAKATRVTSNPKRLPQIQENYAMEAVQRDLNLLLTPDQIDFGGLYIYTTLDPDVQHAAEQALEAQLSKIERQQNFRHPRKSHYQPPADGEDSAMPYLEGAVVVDRQQQRRCARARRRTRLCAKQIQSRDRAGQSPGRLGLQAVRLCAGLHARIASRRFD